MNFDCLILLLVIKFKASFGQIPSHKCYNPEDVQLHRNQNYGMFSQRFNFRRYDYESRWTCSVRNLTLINDDTHFKLVLHMKKDKITKVHFEDSKLKVLSNDICEALPFVRVYEAPHTQILIIEEDAFEKCLLLQTIDLSENLIQSLPPKLFALNKELTRVNLRNNKLQTIDSDIFKENLKLKNLDFEKNLLTDASFIENIPNSNPLKSIILSTNKLNDVDVESLLSKFPNITYLFLSYNNFLCGRQTHMNEFFESMNKSFIVEGACIEYWTVIQSLQKNYSTVISKIETNFNNQQNFNELILIIFGSLFITFFVLLGVGCCVIMHKIRVISDKIQKRQNTTDRTSNEKLLINDRKFKLIIRCK